MSENYETFNSYIKEIRVGLFSRINKIELLEKKQFLKTLENEQEQIKKDIEKLEKSDFVTKNFVNFIKNTMDYGTHSPWWYLISENKNSLDFQAPEVYEETWTNYKIVREWLKKLKEDQII